MCCIFGTFHCCLNFPRAGFWCPFISSFCVDYCLKFSLPGCLMFMNHSFIHSFIHSFKTLLSLSNDGSTTIYNRICKQKGNGKSFHHATQNSILNTFPNNATSLLNIPFWKKIPHQMKDAMYTHAILWFPLSFLAVNHHNIKNWVPSILTHNLWLIFMGMKQKKNFFFLKKNSKWPTQKKVIFHLRQFSIFFFNIFMDGSLG